MTPCGLTITFHTIIKPVHLIIGPCIIVIFCKSRVNMSLVRTHNFSVTVKTHGIKKNNLPITIGQLATKIWSPMQPPIPFPSTNRTQQSLHKSNHNSQYPKTESDGSTSSSGHQHQHTEL